MSKRIAFLFPGQGQVPKELPPLSAEVDGLLAVAERAGLPLRTWIVEQESERLTRTDAAQPAILLDSLARASVLRSMEVAPHVVAGHSLGEYSALVDAGALPAQEAFSVVIQRGRLMNTVAGSMAAILKLDLTTVRSLCADVGPDVRIANHNGPEQIVVSGRDAAVDQLMAAAERAGGKAIRLKVSGPFHSPLMRPAQEALAPEIQRLSFSRPRVPVVSSVSGEAETDAASLKRLLTRQITSCVLWLDVIRTLVSVGVTDAVEVGSGSVLTQLGRRMTDRIRFLTYEEAIRDGV